MHTYIHSNARNKEGIYANNYKATKLVVRNAMNETPTVEEVIPKKKSLKPLMRFHI